MRKKQLKPGRMRMKQTKTTTTKKENITRAWHFIDVENKVLGRVASDIAVILMGKDKANYSPTMNSGGKVVVTNAAKIAVTGNKLTGKIYYKPSGDGYPGATKEESLAKLLARRPEEVVRRAVKGMLPKNKLIQERMKNLYVYAGKEHPHSGQEKS